MNDEHEFMPIEELLLEINRLREQANSHKHSLRHMTTERDHKDDYIKSLKEEIARQQGDLEEQERRLDLISPADIQEERVEMAETVNGFVKDLEGLQKKHDAAIKEIKRLTDKTKLLKDHSALAQEVDRIKDLKIVDVVYAHWLAEQQDAERKQIDREKRQSFLLEWSLREQELLDVIDQQLGQIAELESEISRLRGFPITGEEVEF